VLVLESLDRRKIRDRSVKIKTRHEYRHRPLTLPRSIGM
jgi:hypothetical protein